MVIRRTSPVGTITRERVRRFLAGLQSHGQPATHPNGKANPRAGQPYAPGTIHKVHTTLSAIMGEAVESGMLTANPCRSVTTKLLKPEHRKMDCLTPAEVLALADAIDPHYRILIQTAAYSGLRAGELHALRRRDVDLLAGRLTVNRALKAWSQGVPEFGSTKSGKARTVELAPELVQLLAEHMGPGERPVRPDALVFTNAAGNPIHQVAFLRNHFKPARVKALPDHPTLRFHDLRHTFVSQLIAQGVNVKAIADQAGHASAKMTLDVYAHRFPADDEGVKQALSAAWSSAAPSNVIPIRTGEAAA